MFHWVSRVVDWRFIFGDVEKEEFVNEWRAALLPGWKKFWKGDREVRCFTLKKS